MNEITLNCADAPNAPITNFLATLQPFSTGTDQGMGGHNEEDLPFEITLDRYTRDPWSVLKPPNDPNEKIWKSCWFKSIDNKKKLPGFLQFLSQRGKAAFGKFESPHPDEVTGNINKAVFLVPFQQPPAPVGGDGLGHGADGAGAGSKDDFIFVKYCLDERLTMVRVSHKLKPKPGQMMQMQQQQRMQQRPNPSQQQVPKSIGVGSGLLGNLLGKSQRTNQHLDSVPARKKEKQMNQIDTLSSGQVITKFRDKVEQILKELESSTNTEVKIAISMADLTREMTSMEEKEKVTLKVLEFVVNEAVEDINEEKNEEWTPYKEPGEFMDEAKIIVYKTDHVPAEVMEDLNRGEIPDEVKQQQRAMREAMEREENKKLKALQMQNLKKAAGEHAGISMLGTNRRDRRSIEEIQKDMVDGQKRARHE